jgi:hypothetical protein
VGVGYTGTITGWYLTCYPSATVTVDVWKRNAAIPASGNTITSAAKPSITAGQINSSTSVGTWTQSIAVGDYFMMNVDTNNNATYINLQLIIGT